MMLQKIRCQAGRVTALTLILAGIGSGVDPLEVQAAPVASIIPVQASAAELMARYWTTSAVNCSSRSGTFGPDLIGDGTCSWWQAAVDQSAVESYEQATGDTSYDSDIENTYRKWYGKDYSGLPDFGTYYFDDTAWWGLAWLQAYLRTGNPRYLFVAENDATYIYKNGWDYGSAGYTDGEGTKAQDNPSACGGGTGGVWWGYATSGHPAIETNSSSLGQIAFNSNGKYAGRNAITNELFLELTAWLYNVTGNSSYLSEAESELSWFQHSGLLITSGNSAYVADGYGGAGDGSSPCEYEIASNPQDPTYTYSQGVVLAGLAQLYRATSNYSLLSTAEEIADNELGSAASSTGPSYQYDVLHEWCQACDVNTHGNANTAFKGIFVSGLKTFAMIADTAQYNGFFQVQANSIENTDTNSSNLNGMLWDQAPPNPCPLEDTTSNADSPADNSCSAATQASALDGLVAAQGTSGDRPW
jgi:predicted alpha-1,6-mannanase (GH76 family)